jgi:hypothetical protein
VTDRPLVAVICTAPLVSEGIDAAVGDVMNVQSFPANGDTRGLLGVLRPDAIVVDCPEQAALAAAFAGERDLPVVQVSLDERTLRVLRNGDWQQAEGASVQDVRKLMVGGIFGKGRDR